MDVSPQTIFLLLISILHVISLFDKYEACPADVYYLQIPHRLPQGGYHPPVQHEVQLVQVWEQRERLVDLEAIICSFFNMSEGNPYLQREVQLVEVPPQRECLPDLVEIICSFLSDVLRSYFLGSNCTIIVD